MKITLLEIIQEKKEGTKTVYNNRKTVEKEITEQEYNNYIDSRSFFKRLGGSETAVKEYTCRGYKFTRLTSISPDRQTKILRTFKFE